MSFLCMVEEKLPPGFRFHPSDDELVCDYLVPMIDGAGGRGGSFIIYRGLTLVIVNLNKCEPWELPETARVGEKQWYFFSLHDPKYASGPRTNRATTSGYWKATGKDRAISREGVVVGMRKTLVFYGGRAPKGHKTEWVMHEFRLERRTSPRATPNPQLPFKPKEEWVLCRVFCKSRRVISGQASNSTETSHDDTAELSPPTDEVDYINFGDQPQMDSEERFRFVQVPCFSSDTSQEPPSGPRLQAPAVAMPRSLHGLMITRSGAPLMAQQFGTLPELSSDDNALNHYLSKLQEAAPHAAQGTLGGYTTAEGGLPAPWSDFIL